MLKIGLLDNGKTFSLPVDAAVQTFAFLGIRGAGKTTLGHVMAEEMCKARLPWIALDPVGVWWGLRSTRDGKPSGHPVVVFGGQHGDLPLGRGDGRRIAEALASEPVFAVIDLKMESKRFWHQFVTDFSMALLELNPVEPRHIFIEEAPEFVPQKTKIDLTARCKEAVERLIRLGRNNGYGCTLLSQRPATVDKDCLSQVESLFILRTVGAHDRKALKEWLLGKAPEEDKAMDRALHSLAGLPDGTGYFWSPQWLRSFERVRVRQKETFHPGETRKVGVAPKAATMADVGEFVERLKKQLSKVQAQVPGDSRREDPKKGASRTAPPRQLPERRAGLPEPPSEDNFVSGTVNRDKERIAELEAELAKERGIRRDAEARLSTVRDSLRPNYEAMRTLFEVLSPSKHPGGPAVVDRNVYEPWLERARKRGCGRMLEVLLDRPELTRHQLGILSGVSPTKSTFRAYVAWLKRAGLIEVDGDTVRLRML